MSNPCAMAIARGSTAWTWPDAQASTKIARLGVRSATAGPHRERQPTIVGGATTSPTQDVRDRPKVGDRDLRNAGSQFRRLEIR
jgi:hypothetical protein